MDSLYVVSAVDEVKLQGAIDHGRLSPTMKIAEVKVVVTRLKGNKKRNDTAKQIKTGQKDFADTDLEAAFGRVVKVLERELVNLGDIKCRLRLRERLMAALKSNSISSGTASKSK